MKRTFPITFKRFRDMLRDHLQNLLTLHYGAGAFVGSFAGVRLMGFSAGYMRDHRKHAEFSQDFSLKLLSYRL